LSAKMSIVKGEGKRARIRKSLFKQEQEAEASCSFKKILRILSNLYWISGISQMNVKFEHPVKKYFYIFSIQSSTSYSCKKSNVNIFDKA